MATGGVLGAEEQHACTQSSTVAILQLDKRNLLANVSLGLEGSKESRALPLSFRDVIMEEASRLRTVGVVELVGVVKTRVSSLKVEDLDSCSRDRALAGAVDTSNVKGMLVAYLVSHLAVFVEDRGSGQAMRGEIWNAGHGALDAALAIDDGLSFEERVLDERGEVVDLRPRVILSS